MWVAPRRGSTIPASPVQKPVHDGQVWARGRAGYAETPRGRRETAVKPRFCRLRGMTTHHFSTQSDSGPTADLAVSAHGLVKTFGEQRAVDAVDLTVRRGEVFGVLGPNGAGKTTMLKMLATLLPIDGGRAEIFGHDVRREPHVVRQLLGVTGQYASVDENLTATENLMLFARLQGVDKATARSTAASLLE